MKKKGVSPLIATILIVGLVVAIAGILFAWGTVFTKKQTESVNKGVVGISLAGSVSLELKSVDILPNSRAELTVENTGRTEISNVYARFFDKEKNIGTTPTNSGIPAYSIKDFIVNYDGSLGEIIKVEVFPEVVSEFLDESENISLPEVLDYQNVAPLQGCSAHEDCGLLGEACCSGSCFVIECTVDTDCGAGGTCKNHDDLKNPCYSYCYGGEGTTNPLCAVDNDLDYWDLCEPGPDCDDNNPNVNPEALEICDGVDNDCDGLVDEGLTFDVDNDGYTSLASCSGSKNDCNDNNPNVNPSKLEICWDGVDNDCDGLVNEGCGGGGGGGGKGGKK